MARRSKRRPLIKAYIIPPAFRLGSVPGQVPSKGRLRTLGQIQALSKMGARSREGAANLSVGRLSGVPERMGGPGDPFAMPGGLTEDRLLAQDHPMLSPGSVVSGMGLQPGEVTDWTKFLGQATVTAANEVVFRKAVMEKLFESGLEGAQRKAIFGRALNHWRVVQKSRQAEMLTPDEVLQKAGPYKYKRRWKGKDGKWQYEYPGEKKGKPKAKGPWVVQKEGAQLYVANTETGERKPVPYSRLYPNREKRAAKIARVWNKREEAARETAEQGAVQKVTGPTVDPALWEIAPKFGPAGGPDEIRLTEAGHNRVAQVATGLKPAAAAALEGLPVSGESVLVEKEVGTTIQPTLFGTAHSALAIGALTARGLAELAIDPDRRERAYRLTEKGKKALQDIAVEEARLLDRVRRQEAIQKVPEPIQAAVRRYKTGGESEAMWVYFQGMTAEDKQAVDRWLVETKHPLAYEPGSNEYRFRMIVRELAEKEKEPIQKSRERYYLLEKALYIGPRGGKWADPKHTIPWKPEPGKKIHVVDMTGEDALEAQATPEKEATVETETIYFASGANRASDIRGFDEANHPLGVTATEIMGREAPIAELLKVKVPVFVDSGAFSEVTFTDEGPQVVKPITDEQWEARLDFYRMLADKLGGQVTVVAPDMVGFPEETLARLRKYREQVRELVATGARVLVPLQGADKVRFYAQAMAVLGLKPGDVVPALPMNKAATSSEEVLEFVKRVRPAGLHLLGISPEKPAGKELVQAIRAEAPDLDLSADSNRIIAKVGTRARPGPIMQAKDRIAQEQAEARWAEGAQPGEMGQPGDYTDMISQPSAWLTETAKKRVADELGLVGEDRKRWLAAPDAFLQEAVGGMARWEDPDIQRVLDNEWAAYHAKTTAPEKQRRAIREVFTIPAEVTPEKPSEPGWERMPAGKFKPSMVLPGQTVRVEVVTEHPPKALEGGFWPFVKNEAGQFVDARKTMAPGGNILSPEKFMRFLKRAKATVVEVEEDPGRVGSAAWEAKYVEPRKRAQRLLKETIAVGREYSDEKGEVFGAVLQEISGELPYRVQWYNKASGIWGHTEAKSLEAVAELLLSDLGSGLKLAPGSLDKYGILTPGKMETPAPEVAIPEKPEEAGNRGRSDYEERQEARRERFELRAEKLRRKAAAADKASSQMASHIPMGQPVLVGHHSEKRHRRDIARIQKLATDASRAHDEAQRLEQKARSVGRAGVSSDDPEAVKKLLQKVEALKGQRNMMKEINRAYKKHKGDWTAIQKETGAHDRMVKEGQDTLRLQPYYKQPFPTYALTNIGATIRTAEKRIEVLRAEARTEASPDIEGRGYKIIENTEANRIQIVFEGKPPPEVRARLKGNGFRWSPHEGAWQRMLNNAGRYAAGRVAKDLGGAGEPAVVEAGSVPVPEEAGEPIDLSTGVWPEGANPEPQVSAPDKLQPEWGQHLKQKRRPPEDPGRMVKTLESGAVVRRHAEGGSHISLLMKLGPNQWARYYSSGRRELGDKVYTDEWTASQLATADDISLVPAKKASQKAGQAELFRAMMLSEDAMERVQILTPDDLSKGLVIPAMPVTRRLDGRPLQKGEARGGKYHRRVPVAKAGAKSKYRYFYKPEDYDGRKDAHVDGQAAGKAYLTKQVLQAIEGAGGKGCTPDALSGLVKKFGAKKVAEVLRENQDGGTLAFKKGKFSLCQKAKG